MEKYGIERQSSMSVQTDHNLVVLQCNEEPVLSDVRFSLNKLLSRPPVRLVNLGVTHGLFQVLKATLYQALV